MTTTHEAGDGESPRDATRAGGDPGRPPRRSVELAIIAVVVLGSLGIHALTSTDDAASAPTASTVPTASTTSTADGANPTSTTVGDAEPVSDADEAVATTITEPTTTPDSVENGNPEPTITTPPTSPTIIAPSPVPLPSRVAWIELTGGQPATGRVAACRAEHRMVFDALLEHVTERDSVPADADALAERGQLPVDPDTWTARWSFAAIGDSTYVVPTPGGACDL